MFALRNEYSVNTNDARTEETAITIGEIIIKYANIKLKTDKEIICHLISSILEYIRNNHEIIDDLVNNPHNKIDEKYLYELFIVYFKNIVLNTFELQKKYNIYEKTPRNVVSANMRYYITIIEANNFINNIATKYKISINKMADDLTPEIFKEFKKYIKEYIFPEINKDFIQKLSNEDKHRLFLEKSICHMYNVEKTTTEHNNNIIDKLDVICEDIQQIKKKQTKTCEPWEVTTSLDLDYIDFTKLP